MPTNEEVKVESVDIERVRQAKKRQLLFSNLLMGGLLGFYAICVFNQWPTAYLLILGTVVLIGIAMYKLFSLWRGEAWGSKDIRVIEAFEKEQMGREKWCRNRGIEISILIAFPVIALGFLGLTNFGRPPADLFSFFLPTGLVWVLINAREIGNIKKLSK
ncbi:hypothetical protein [Halobacillus sp. Cin3]|uniref:hypothetical protein n=1 Tax=Halobacillus sp. Cin3 TaxID=2928441 RepID=UPI00248DC068|nr:hypothetical protein [Halobacillus sp. Cin3]